ncbi:MAG: RIO1 family regulatory kinase/ATPase [Candidatus Nitrosotenuis sp.]
MKQFFPVNDLANEPYSAILGYPHATKSQIKSRVKELKQLGIDGVSFEGPMVINKICVLGKGYAGIVVLAKQGTNKVALKIRRTDSPRKDMKGETKLLSAANKVRVGPKLISSSKNFVVMEFVSGKKIYDWVDELKGKGSTAKLKSVIKKVLTDCYRLDEAGLDHGELSNITKHVIVGKNITMIDFESASLERRASNVTSASQAMLIGSGLANMVNRIYKLPPKQKIISSLRSYKENRTKESFDQVLEVLKLA